MPTAAVPIRAPAISDDRRRRSDGPDWLEIVASQDLLLLQHAASITAAVELLLRVDQIEELPSAASAGGATAGARSGEPHDLLVHELRRVHRRKVQEQIGRKTLEINRKMSIEIEEVFFELSCLQI